MGEIPTLGPRARLLARTIVDAVAGGHYSPDTRIPGRDHWKVNGGFEANTHISALEWLVAVGVLSTPTKAGSFVRSDGRAAAIRAAEHLKTLDDNVRGSTDRAFLLDTIDACVKRLRDLG